MYHIIFILLYYYISSYFNVFHYYIMSCYILYTLINTSSKHEDLAPLNFAQGTLKLVLRNLGSEFLTGKITKNNWR